MNCVWAVQDLPLSFQPLCMILSTNSHGKKGGQVGGKHLTELCKATGFDVSKTSRSNKQVVLIGLPNPWILTAYPDNVF